MNKKLFLMLSVVAASITTKAQTQKGNHLLGGGFGVGFDKATVTGMSNNANYQYLKKTTSLSVGPTYSFFIADKLDLGISGNWNWGRSRYTDQDNSITYKGQQSDNSTSVLANVYLRKYFLYNNKVGIRTGPFVQYLYGRSRSFYVQNLVDDYNVADTKFSTKAFSAGIGLDFVYFPTSRLGITAALGSLAYSHANQSQDDIYRTKTDSFGVSLVSSLNLSLVFALGN
ncbi:outer membrane beta-barrel protein [Mucilaginibacter lacusdianchii]|uniref:outer membrane beta-barrel protein n=1 Tax=Mucilaginibacter lacusdianchii TaxID=2684211 RepID=UPI00131D736C|nr:outer membrane beta-barrel protein [Mucilaginibacter sp. JXJ CY 39]